MANDFHATHVLLVLIGGFHLCSTAESGIPLAATSKSISASITEAEYRQLNTTLMDVVNKYSNFEEAYQQTSSGRATVLANGQKLGLTDEESLAAMIYTTDAVHSEFNRILREGDTSKYDTSFQVFHFLLISAIEKIRKKQTLAEWLYRGVDNIFSAAKGTELRLPGYTSTSTDISVANGPIFRDDKGTLIHLKGVKYGADISGFSVNPSESEILIPPYESFKVTNVSTDSIGPIIYLESIGEKCGAVNHDHRRRRYTGRPCRCCRQPLNGDVPLQTGWAVLAVPLAVYLIITVFTRHYKVRGGKKLGLTDEESLAAMVNTTTAVYSEFNRILREGDTSKYDTSYQVLNFRLISAIEKIRVKQTLAEYLYRGAGIIFSATQGAELRLPGYTSTSTRLSIAQSLRGAKGTLIRLRGVTFGAVISGFSLYPSEAEVLIPPDESFKVTAVSTDDKRLLIDLESIGEKCGSVLKR